MNITPDYQKYLTEGSAAAAPICIGYAAIGMAFGVLAQKSGFTPFEIGFMSVVVFAGSAQFIAISMLSGGASAFSVVFTTFAVNLRHFLMSSALSLYVKNRSFPKLSLFAYGVTDESFGVNMARFREGGWGFGQSLVVHHVANLAWIASTIAGGIFGQMIPEGAFGVDYALIAMFIALLVFQFTDRIAVYTALIGGALGVVFAIFIPGNFYIILGSVCAAGLGLFIPEKMEKKNASV